MTFTALSPWVAWLLIAAAAAGGAAVFAVRPRAARHVVSSLTIWLRVLDAGRKRSLWDRIRWLVSLAITAVIAAAMAAAIAKPAPPIASRSTGRILLLLDSSWSMLARTPSGSTRWQRAIQSARAMADASGAGEIALATTAEGVVEGPTSDLALIHNALNRLAPSGGPDRGWPRIAGATAHFFTDGALARATPSDVTVHSVFAPAPNVAVTAFDVQPAAIDGTPAEAFLAVANYARTAQAVHVTVTRGTNAVFDRSIEIPAGASHREVIDVPPAGDARFHAHVSATSNELAIDDDAVAWLWTAQPLRVVGVRPGSDPAGPAGSDPGLTPRLLANDTTLHVSTVDPSGYAQAKADVWVFERWLPPSPPASPALIIDPPASSWLGPRGAEEAQAIWRPGATHQILEGVDTTLVRVAHARAVERPSLLPIAVSERNTPLVAVEDSVSGRFVVLAFSTLKTDFTSTPGFPILVGNAIDWLGRPERGAHHQPGPVVLPAATRRVIAPNGRSLPVMNVDNRVTATLPAPGLYLVESTGGQGVISVGLDDPARSNLLASTVPPDRGLPIQVRAAGRPWWTYAVWAALGLVALEWVTWRRRITV